MGSVTNKPLRQFPGGQSHSLDTDLWRVSEILNMFDLLPIHHDKTGSTTDPNQLCKHYPRKNTQLPTGQLQWNTSIRKALRRLLS